MNQFPGFEYRQDKLFVEQVDIPRLALEYGTPFYVYSKSALTSRWVELCTAFSSLDFLPCYAVKANSNIAVLQMLSQWGAGFDIVSLGELERVLTAGGDASKIMFSGVAKREDEIRKAIHCQIGCINVESEYELGRIREIAAEMKMHVNVSLRINPNVNPNTHPYISTGLKESKFGITSELALKLYASIKDDPWVKPVGVDCHIGSQITDTQPYVDAAEHVFEFVENLEQLGIKLKHIDLGGGFGITYENEKPPEFNQYADVITPLFEGKDYQLVLEPGRSIVANAGALVTAVEYVKDIEVTEFVLVDAAMNDLIRPALYQAWHNLMPVTLNANREDKVYDVVGPVCESGDFFAKQREMKQLLPGELLAVMSAGAYAMTMASNYNTRQRPCELMIDGDDVHLIRRRDAIDELWQNEVLLPAD
ncbi:MAG: diaminopimelate decarboxylase [Gammaproteobacteria bacterium]|nr:diaminopimelate decarboxylase [Gammaproteobacteria bacterium]